MKESQIMKALFAQQRIQIMHIAKHHDEFTDAYLYAWDNSVYPLLSDTDGSIPALPHEIYENHFLINKDKVDLILTRLDDAYVKEEKLTFYGLESELGVKRGGLSGWDRSDLLRICRYLFLDECFDEAFWSVLTTNGQCPAEALSLTRSFDRLKHISFM